FCSEQSLGLDEIAASLKLSYGWELNDEDILAAIESIRQKYAGEGFPFELVEISEGFQFLTKKEFHPTVNALIQHKAKKKLSVAQMETLSIIAYKQPISKSEVEHIRGVNCDYAVQKLLEKELISISGKSDGPGRPILYTTSENFMDYFGIKSVKDLPQLKDIHVESNEIGQPAEYAEASINEETVAPLEETIEIAESMEVVAGTERDIEVLSELSDTPEEREMLSTDAVHGHLDESELHIPDRRQIYMENQEGATDDSSIEEPNRDNRDLHS
ncbi:MAG: SMC-Scp complex subunit ScpB, partial [Bacteroidota bacterium]